MVSAGSASSSNVTEASASPVSSSAVAKVTVVLTSQGEKLAVFSVSTSVPAGASAATFTPTGAATGQAVLVT